MKELNPLLHSQLRLAVMSILMVQLDKLSSAGYISVEKGMSGKRPRTICSITDKGRDAFEDYVATLKLYLHL